MPKQGRVSARTAEEARHPIARQAAPSPDAVGPATVLGLQRTAGNAAVAQLLQRSLAIGGHPLSARQITQHSAHKRRLNSIIGQEARTVGLTPAAVRQELVQMASSGNHDFDTQRAAVREAIGRLLESLPVEKLPIRGMVKRALAGLTGSGLSQAVILQRLEAAFGTTARVHQASRRPEFAEVLLEEIRTRQSTTWTKATEIHQAKPATWTNQEKQHWNLRHYTNKFNVVLGESVGDGVFKVQDVAPPPFTELLSSVTLATMNRGGGASTPAYRAGDTMMLTFSSGAATSGHTTGVDWKNIGNVGDTFYGLFYKDEPATGLTPGFIKDAVYFATWPVDEFGTGWASADWLGTAAESQTEGAKTPDGKARQGELSDIIADIFPESATRDLSGTGGKEAPGDQFDRQSAFNAMSNFEVKKHGAMTVKAWLPIKENLDKIKQWRVDTKSGKLIKLDTEVKTNVDTPGWTLLKAARSLHLLQIERDGREEIYRWGVQKFDGETGLAAKLDEDSSLFEELRKAVEEERLREAQAEETAKLNRPSGPPPPPPPGGPGPPGGKTLATVGGSKESN